MGRWICMIPGVLFLLLGFIGLLLPIIPQIPFLAIGIILMMLGSRRFSKWVRERKIYREHIKKWLEKSRFFARILKKLELEERVEEEEQETSEEELQEAELQDEEFQDGESQEEEKGS